MQDLSRNGITLNGRPIKKNAIILMDGDIIRLPNSLGESLISARLLLLTHS